MKHDMCVVGGAGHIGLPLAIVLGSGQLRTLIYDTNPGVFSRVRHGRMPFLEERREPLLRQMLPNMRSEHTIQSSKFRYFGNETPIKRPLNSKSHALLLEEPKQ
jgi:UDP-N-acetyl-D-mannosaminuronate dehydrogenase